MKPFICACFSALAVFLSFKVTGQQNNHVTAPPTSRRLPHYDPGKYPAIGMGFYRPRDPQKAAAEMALFSQARQLEKEAKRLYASGDLAGAEHSCLQALKAAPVIDGQQQQMPYTQRLLGRVYLRQGRNQDALKAFQSCYSSIPDAGQNLDIAIAYARMGDYEHAHKFYSDQAILQYRLTDEPLKPEDLPGTSTLKSLEASALLARGVDAFFEHRQDEALDDFMASERLAPDNALVAYYCAQTLLEKGRNAEAVPRLKRVSASPRARIFGDVKGMAYSLESQAKAHH